MNKYQDKESSMDDYSHERKLRIDGRYEGLKEKWLRQKMTLIMPMHLKKMHTSMQYHVKAVLFYQNTGNTTHKI